MIYSQILLMPKLQALTTPVIYGSEDYSHQNLWNFDTVQGTIYTRNSHLTKSHFRLLFPLLFVSHFLSISI